MSGVNYKVLSSDGKEIGSIDLDPKVFDAEVLEYMVHDAVVWQRNKKRAGTHSALTKAEVSGGGKKPWKQKGTGNARAGSNTSPLWVGGGVTHGPKPRDYTTRLSKRARRQALCSVLTFKARNEGLKIIDSLTVKSGKTRDMAKVFKNLGVAGESITLIQSDNENGTNIEKVSRNIVGVKPIKVSGINVYDLLKHKYLIATKDDILALQGRILKESGKAE